jgi:hypothetical protein
MTSTLALIRDGRRTLRQGPDALAHRQRERLAAMIDFARTHSPYYRELYRALPERVEDSALLPVTRKQNLMARFDDWITDPEVSLDRVRAFVADPGGPASAFWADTWSPPPREPPATGACSCSTTARRRCSGPCRCGLPGVPSRPW